MDYYCFHDVDVAPQGASLKEFQSNLDVISDKLLSKQKETGVKLLWATQNLFSHPRYKDGAATAPSFDSFAFGCAQTKKMLEVGKKLSAETHVFWGGREGFATALNTKAMRLSRLPYGSFMLDHLHDSLNIYIYMNRIHVWILL